VRDLLNRLPDYAKFKALSEALESEQDRSVEGLWGSAAAYVVAALSAGASRTHLCVLPDIEQAEKFAEDMDLFAPGLAMLFPARETLIEERLPDAEILSRRLAVLKALRSRRESPTAAGRGMTIVAPVQAVLQTVPSVDTMSQNVLMLREGTNRSPETVAAWLEERGFQRVRQVEVPGEYSRRGGILDVFPYVTELPCRVEFLGNEIASVREFDPATQVSTKPVEEFSLTALSRRTAPKRKWATLFDHLPSDTLVVLREPAEIAARAESFSAQEMDPLQSGPIRGENAFLDSASLQFRLSKFQKLNMAPLPGTLSGKPSAFHVHSTERFRGEIATVMNELALIVKERGRTIIFCANAGERRRLREMLSETAIKEDERFEIRIGRLHEGFDWPDLSLALLTHHEIFHRYRQRRVGPRFRHTRAVESFYDLEKGDLVVHVNHGIGLFRGMELIEREGRKEENLRIEYADRAFLYVPASRIELVQKYIGPAERRPPLNRLGTRAWANRKARAERAVKDLAADLLRLQAVREGTPGIVHPADDEWQREFESAFPYEETPDQLRVADEVKRDMEAPRPTDRLICGDVGYGKTEIAMRAAFKAVMGGRQAAVLVPTTVLAAQHTATFCERMADYPVRIEMLSRFVTRSKQNAILDDLAEGRVDIVIGTHRLVQPDVRFRDLGLAIVDEEQRFGVAHKERLKHLRHTVDVLTLTATPIPRTLHMSLLGIRDISSLDTPIRDRLAIRTRLMRFDPHKVRQAVLHEMARDGQVFFVHNRVETIGGVAAQLRELLPEATIVVGHGQMSERELAHAMRDFVEREADVLVCTTIIESGLDIPNANTIIIHEADMFGLADLHQLRGRVGRYKHRAYAYLLLPANRPIAPAAEKRLKAIEEFSDLGAGFRIALRDLEIRGAGNILGAEQSGHLAAIGYDLYCRLMERAVRELRNEPPTEPAEVAVALGVEAYVPETYVGEPAHRIELYRKLHRASSAEHLTTIRDEMRDRFGPLPPAAKALLAEARLRQLARAHGIRAISIEPESASRRAVSARYPLVLDAPEVGPLIAALEAGGRRCRVIDDHTVHLDAERSHAADNDTRISPDVLLSFLIETLERIERDESPA